MKTKRVIKKTKAVKVQAVEPEVLEPVENELYSTIRGILAKARATAYVAANTAMVEAYWNVGREIVEKQGGKRHAKYGDALVKTLAIRLTVDFGAGFTAANLFNMRQFYLAFPNFYTLCRELSWSHYRLLMRIEDEKARQYYLDECAKSHWSVRLLQRQIDTQFYQRLMRNRINPKSMKALVKRDSAAVKVPMGSDPMEIPRPHGNSNLVVGGRLGGYKYYDMDQAMAAALELPICEASC